MRKQLGFTMVEVLVTLAIMGMIMMGLQVTLDTAIFAHDDIAVDIAQVRDGPRILDMVERDIRSLHLFNIKDREVIRGTSERQFGMRADRIDLISGVDSTQRFISPLSSYEETEMLASDITEVGYRLRPREDHEDFLELYRREDMFVDEDPLEGGRYELLHDRVTWFEITYLKQLGVDAETEEDWEMKPGTKLPAAIMIKLRLQARPDLIGDHVSLQERANLEYTYNRVIPIRLGHNNTLLVRPAMPVPSPTNSGDDGSGPGTMGGPGMPMAPGEGFGDGFGGPGGGSGDDTKLRSRGGSSVADMGGGGRNGRGFSGDIGDGLRMNPDLKLDGEDQSALDDLLEEYMEQFNGQ